MNERRLRARARTLLGELETGRRIWRGQDRISLIQGRRERLIPRRDLIRQFCKFRTELNIKCNVRTGNQEIKFRRLGCWSVNDDPVTVQRHVIPGTSQWMSTVPVLFSCGLRQVELTTPKTVDGAYADRFGLRARPPE